MTGHIKLENDDYDNRQAKAMQYTLAHPHQVRPDRRPTQQQQPADADKQNSPARLPLRLVKPMQNP